jgi:hypothetical protein
LQGVKITTDYDRSQLSINSCCGGYAGGEQGLDVVSNYYTGLENTQNTFGTPPVPSASYGGFHTGFMNTLNASDSGQKFGQWNVLNCYGTGDCIGNFAQLSADGGINRKDDEGIHWADIGVTEDVNVFTGTLTGSPATGATTLTTNCTYGCGTQGMDRLLIDTNPAKDLTGVFDGPYTDLGTPHGIIVSPIGTQIPNAIIDSNSSLPISTLVTLCYAGSDNGVGGAAGCPTNGTAPTGYILANVNSPSQQAPSSPIVTSVMDAWTNIPPQFCTNTTLQSSSSGSACYMPASGVGCLSDAQEYETVNYTYNSTTQQVTLLNLTSSHVNGMTFATGGLCGYAIEQAGTIYTGTGTYGVQSQVFPVEGTLDAHTIYYISQRTNKREE